MPDLGHILLIEDDLRLSKLIKEYLSQQGFIVSIETRGDTGLTRIMGMQPDLVILDLMLPGLDGLTICRKIRPQYSGPVMMLTAREDDTDQVVGLEMGADDYVKKPVEPRVLLARIRALLRRLENPAVGERKELCEPEHLMFDSLSINRSSQTVLLGKQSVELTTNEFSLLWILATHCGQALDRETLFQLTKGIAYDGIDRSVDITISRLRKKINDNAAKPWRIKTIWGQGYLFVKDAWRDPKIRMDR